MPEGAKASRPTLQNYCVNMQLHAFSLITSPHIVYQQIAIYQPIRGTKFGNYRQGWQKIRFLLTGLLPFMRQAGSLENRGRRLDFTGFSLVNRRLTVTLFGCGERDGQSAVGGFFGCRLYPEKCQNRNKKLTKFRGKAAKIVVCARHVREVEPAPAVRRAGQRA
jgi:hypothetical protein